MNFPKESLATVSIYIVDDEPEHCEMVKTFVNNIYKFQSVKTETNSNRALEHLKKSSYDILILDNIMPEVTGLDLIEFISEFEAKRLHKSEIILLSGSVEGEHVEKCINLGVTNILVKPVTQESLHKKLDEVLHDVFKL